MLVRSLNPVLYLLLKRSVPKALHRTKGQTVLRLRRCRFSRENRSSVKSKRVKSSMFVLSSLHTYSDPAQFSAFARI